ncbi:MAG: Asp23/Gls24 family envelope stress response protein, partial [Neisseria elongata]
ESQLLETQAYPGIAQAARAQSHDGTLSHRMVEYGVSIVEVADAIRRNIIEQIEGTTGLEVVRAWAGVVVIVCGVLSLT